MALCFTPSMVYGGPTKSCFAKAPVQCRCSQQDSCSVQVSSARVRYMHGRASSVMWQIAMFIMCVLRIYIKGLFNTIHNLDTCILYNLALYRHIWAVPLMMCIWCFAMGA